MTIHTLSTTACISVLDLEHELEGRGCLCSFPPCRWSFFHTNSPKWSRGCPPSLNQNKKEKELGLNKFLQMFSIKNTWQYTVKPRMVKWHRVLQASRKCEKTFNRELCQTEAGAVKEFRFLMVLPLRDSDISNEYLYLTRLYCNWCATTLRQWIFVFASTPNMNVYDHGRSATESTLSALQRQELSIC